MSRGRGGARGGGAAARRIPGSSGWDLGEEIDGRPSDLFPKYEVSQAKVLSKLEERRINHFLLFRRQVHSSVLYTCKRTMANEALKARRAYRQDQVNQKYKMKSKATVDPFTAIETYSQRFVEEERTLPNFSTQPFCKDLFPAELHATINGNDCPASQRRRCRETRLELNNITTTDEFGQMQNGEARVRALAANLEEGEDDVAEGGLKGDEESNHGDEEEEDYAYDDEEGGDYDAEGYFDDGDNDDMDDGDDGEAVY